MSWSRLNDRWGTYHVVTRFLRALFWETLQNLPMIAGFLIGARLIKGQIWLALSCAMIGILAGVVLMHFTEARLHVQEYQSTLKGAVVNGLIFFALAVPFLFYFSSESRWINWKADLLLGMVIGLLMAGAQAMEWRGARRRMIQHALAMAAACPLIMLAVRYTLHISSWAWLLLACLAFTILASAVIVWIDYWPEIDKAEQGLAAKAGIDEVP